MTEPIIILGAARSGTKMLRDTLAAAADLSVVEYDVNYIWRFDNERFPHDGLPAEAATERVQAFVRRQLPRIAVGGQQGGGRFVEKTVGNVLRLPFVRWIYPRARYVFLIRDGRDVAESAARCWQTPPRMGYLLRKLRTFPWLAGAHYGASYAGRVLQRKFGLAKQLSSWGPRYPGIDDDVIRYALLEVCARQWVACIEAYEQARHELAADQLTEVRYEDVVRQPHATLGALCERLAIRDIDAVLDYAGGKIVAGNVGKQSQLAAEDRAMVGELQRGVLARWEYVARPAVRVA